MDNMFMAYASHMEQREYIKHRIISCLQNGIHMTISLLEDIVNEVPDYFTSEEVQEIINEI